MPYRIVGPPPAWLELHQIELEADNLIAGRNLRLFFPRALEALYNEERLPRRQGQLIRMGLFALLAFDMFLVGDYLGSPHHFVEAAVVRLGVVTPLTLVAMLLVRRLRPSAPEQEFAATMLCVIACAALLYLHHGSWDATLLEAEPGVLLLLIAMNALLRPEFWIAVVGTVCCLGMFVTTMLAGGDFSHLELWNFGGHIFWFSLLSLTANYAMVREQRYTWLLQLRGRIQQRMLAEANTELLNLSMQDPLTAIPNRYAYERRLAELWQKAVEDHTPIAAVMVDVDYFKEVNDSFGHLFGDRVLQRIANLLQQAMRAEEDFVARYGGEEFVVLLPGSDIEAGAYVAERIRKLVEVAGSPAVSRGDAPLPANAKWSTVSCGVASIVPTEKDEPKGLIDAADAALYLAKQSGRNRVCTTGTLTLVQSA